MADVFISYKREEREAARQLAEALQKHQFSVWWDADLLPGEQYRAVTLEILQSCRAAIVIWSPRSVQSSWVLDEAQRALDRGVLVPVQLEKITVYPLGFGQLHAHDLTSWDGSPEHAALQPVIAAVRRLAGAPEHALSSAPSQSEVETEVAFWRGVHDSREAADFEAYLKRYPDGLFAELARQRLVATSPAAPMSKRRKRKAAAGAKTAPEASRPQKAEASPEQVLFNRTEAPPLTFAGSTAEPFKAPELIFITTAVVVAAFVAWPLANTALGLRRVFFSEDYALLFTLETPQNLFIMTPLLVGLGWGYDRAKIAWTARGKSPLLVQYGVLASLIAFFLLSLGMRQHGGRETHFALWLILTWAAATFARPAVAHIQPIVRQQLSRRS